MISRSTRLRNRRSGAHLSPTWPEASYFSALPLWDETVLQVAGRTTNSTPCPTSNSVTATLTSSRVIRPRSGWRYWPVLTPSTVRTWCGVPMDRSGRLSTAGLPNGWICMAASSQTDQVEMSGISAPLRVCLNSTLPGKVEPACANSSTTPPSCTDGCTAPPHFGVTLLDLPLP